MGQPLGVPFTLGLKHTLKYEVEVGLYFPRSWEFEEIPTWERLWWPQAGLGYS